MISGFGVLGFVFVYFWFANSFHKHLPEHYHWITKTSISMFIMMSVFVLSLIVIR